jgi:hypothetical protein
MPLVSNSNTRIAALRRCGIATTMESGTIVARMDDFEDLGASGYLVQQLSPADGRRKCSKHDCAALASKVLIRNPARAIPDGSSGPILEEKDEKLFCEEHFEERRAEINTEGIWPG